MKPLPFALAPLALALSAPALAANTVPALDETVVTASRVNQSTFDVTPSTQVINRNMIEASPARDIGDLLRLYGGVQVARSGGLGAQTSIFIRGAESNHTLILIDGVAITDGVTGGGLIQNIPTEQIERIEVVKGPQSTLFGSEAIGGVINIITREAKTNAGSIRLTAGNNGLLEGAINHSLVGSNNGIILTLEGTRFDGEQVFRVDPRERGYKRDSLTINAFQKLDQVRLSLLHRETKAVADYFGFSFLGFPELDQDLNQRQTQIKAAWQVNNNTDLSVTLSDNDEVIAQNQSNAIARTQQQAADAQLTIKHNANTSVFGVTLTSLDITNNTQFGNYDNSPNTSAFYAQNTWSANRWSMTAGIRAQRDDRFGSVETGNAGISYNIDPQLKLFASIGSGYKTPDGQDLASNINLKPERSRSLELGVRSQSTNRQWQIAAFETHIKQLIGFDDSFNVRNIDRARIHGIEASFRESIGDFTLYGNASFLRPIDLTTGDDLSRRPRRSMTVGSEWRYNKATSFVELLARSDSDNSGFDTSQLPGFAVVNIGTQIAVNPQLTFGLAVDNLFDTDHSYAQTGTRRFLAQPRQIKATTVYRY